MTRTAQGNWRSAETGWAGRVGAATAGLMIVATAPTAADAEGTPGADASDAGVDQAAHVGLSLSGGGRTAAPGEEVVFRTTVSNADSAESEPVDGALLAQHVPESLRDVEVEGEGRIEEGIVNWLVSVPQGEEVEFTVRARVAEDAAPGGRVASTVCLLLERDADPAACASDTVVVAESAAVSRVGEMVGWEGLVRAMGIALVGAMAWLLWRRRSALRRH